MFNITLIWLKNWKNLGAQIIAIKDMAGLLKPQGAYRLISELKGRPRIYQFISIPTILAAMGSSLIQRLLKRGVDIVDVAMSAMSGATSPDQV